MSTWILRKGSGSHRRFPVVDFSGTFTLFQPPVCYAHFAFSSDKVWGAWGPGEWCTVLWEGDLNADLTPPDLPRSRELRKQSSCVIVVCSPISRVCLHRPGGSCCQHPRSAGSQLSQVGPSGLVSPCSGASVPLLRMVTGSCFVQVSGSDHEHEL